MYTTSTKGRKILDSFLDNDEKRLIQNRYTRIQEHFKPDMLIPSLFENGTITPTEKDKLQCMKTNDEKVQYIIDNVFLKATYQQIVMIRQLLVNSRLAGHIQIANDLPNRGDFLHDESDEMPWNDTGGGLKPPRTESEPITFSKVMTPVDEFNSKTMFNSPKGHMTSSSDPELPCLANTTGGEVSAVCADVNDLFLMSEADQDQVKILMTSQRNHISGDNSVFKSEAYMTNFSEGENNVKPAGPFSKVAQSITSCIHPGEAIDKSTRHSESCPQIANITDNSLVVQRSKLLPYEVKHGNDPQFGKGICVVIKNFTGDFEGYIKDSRDIVSFHSETLGWEHVYEDSLPTEDPEKSQSLQNLSRAEFMKVLKLIQQFLTNPFSGNKFDRFFLYILSHGDKYGLMTNQEGSDTECEEDDKNGQPIRVQMQEIIDMFTHEKVPFLKGFPKVIFHQACQGPQPLKAATLPTHEDKDQSIPIHPDPPIYEPPKHPVTIGADIALCQATGKDAMSWVGCSGSMFIQNSIKVMKAHYHTEHFLDIMGEVNHLISKTNKNGINPHTREKLKAVQMSCVHTTLTHKFYLALPGHLQIRKPQKPQFYQ